MPARTPSGLPRPLRYGCVATLLACALTCAALLALLPHDSPAAFVYPGAVPSRATPAPQLGLYGAFETPDSVDTVARWYAARGLTGAAMTGGGAAGSGGRPARVPIPGVGRALLIGREVYYMALSDAGHTLINVWCRPICLPSDSSPLPVLLGP
jgi:hypothetical protein